MNCKSCNTRIPAGQQSCPACGRGAASGGRSTPARSEAADEPLPLTDSINSPPKRDGGTSSADSSAKSRKAKKPKFVADRKAPSPSRSEPVSSLFSLDPGELRSLLIDQPELLEPGLCLLSGDSGEVVGARYATDVGEIDLLAVDGRGDFVVVMVVERDSTTELISGLLQRIGWVRKHLSKDGKDVRAIVLTEPLSEEVRYSAAAVAGTVDFKTYRIAVSFDDLEV